MAHHPTFNNSSLNASGEGVLEHQPSTLSITDPGSDPDPDPDPESDPGLETLLPPNEESQSNSGTLPPSYSNLQSSPKDQDEHSSVSSSSSGGSDEQAYRWGSCEDTYTTIKPYCGVLASLDRAHSTSLSNHLYSAHLIKKRNFTVPDSHSDSYPESDSGSPTRAKKRQRREYSPSTPADDTLLPRSKRFITNSWTSWPHPPSHVPRESEHKSLKSKSLSNKMYFDDDTYDRSLRKKGVDAPSQMLEEMLTATFLRMSKERLRSRPEMEREGVVPALDDDVSAHMLKPIVRSIISKLGELLIGLYHERRYVKALVAQVEEEEEVVVVEQEGMKGKRKTSQYKQTQARKKAQSTARKGVVTPTTDTEEDDESVEGEGGELSKTRRRKPAPPKLAKKYAVKRRSRLRLRDWSQVLGTASLTGWDRDTLQKTVKRCEEQFEQTMNWRQLKQDDHIKEKRSGEVWTGARLKPVGCESDEDERGINKDGFMVPIKGVGRKKRPTLKPSLKKRRKMKARTEKKGASNPGDMNGNSTESDNSDAVNSEESDASVDTG